MVCHCLTYFDCCEIAGTAPFQCQNRTQRETLRRMGPERALGSVFEPVLAFLNRDRAPAQPVRVY
eukprot:15442267-Alexandrium_andersonii.AAC.1